MTWTTIASTGGVDWWERQKSFCSRSLRLFRGDGAKNSRAPWRTLAGWGAAAISDDAPLNHDLLAIPAKTSLRAASLAMAALSERCFRPARNRGVPAMAGPRDDLLRHVGSSAGSCGTKCSHHGGTTPPTSRRCTTSLKTAKATKAPMSMFRWASMPRTSTKMLLESRRSAAGR